MTASPCRPTTSTCAGFKQLGTIDYNPVVPALGPGRRPEDVGGVRGHVGLHPAVHAVRRDLVRRPHAYRWRERGGQRHQLLVSYTLSKAEDNSTDFQSAFIPQQNGRGRDPGDLNGLPVGFDPDSERGPSTQDQRHRFVASGRVPGARRRAAVGHRHARLGPPVHAPGRRRPQWRRQRRRVPARPRATRSRQRSARASAATPGRCRRRRSWICG